MSRARLGLYVFCRQSLFASCYELAPTFSQLLSRPSQLALVTGEVFPAIRSSAADVVPFMVEGLSQLGMIVQQMAITALQRQPELAKATVPTPVVSKSDDGDEDVAMDRPSVLEDAPTPPPADDAPTPPPAQPSDDGDEDAPMGAAEPVILPPTAARVEPQAVSVEVDNTLAPSEPAAAVSIPTVTPVVTVPVVAPSVAAPAAVPEPDVTPAVSVPVPEPAPSASVPLPVFTPAVSVPVPEVTQATVTPSTSSDGAAAASSSSPAITLALEFDSHAGVVVVGNHSSEPINLGNYVIKASASQYVFDSSVVIAPEGRVTVWTGKVCD